MTRARDIANFGDGIVTADIDDGAVTAGKLNSTLDLSSKTITGIPTTNECAIYIRNFGASVDGGSSSSGWNTIPLNTELLDNIGASISSSEITLPAGTYYCTGFCQAYRTDRAGCRLRDTTNSVTLMTGGATYGDSPNNVNSHAYLNGTMTLSAETSFYFQYYITTALAGNGFGVRPNNGESWQQSYLNIWKIA